MLPTKLLKLRLARIEKGEGHLSTQDKLMLVSMESPDLSANFFLRLFKVSLPKQWKFQHETDEDILYTSQLIKLIENEFIPSYESHARKHAWYEQCLVYQLNFVVPQPTQPQINLYLRQLDKCLDQQPKIDLLLYFQQQYPSAKHAVALAKAYAGAEQYTEAIKQHEWASQQSIQRSEIAFYAYIECLVNRNQSEYMLNVSDVEYAIDLLSKFEKPVDQKTYLKTLKSAVNALLPAVILQTQAVETNILADVGRSLNSLGKSIGGMLGGRDFQLPYNKEVIANAPQLLTHPLVFAGLAESSAIQNALLRLLKNDQQCADTLLLKLWLAIQQDMDIWRWLVEPIQSEQFIQALSKVEYEQQQTIISGPIQLILEQGLMQFLGDFRLDKQHSERPTLYEQRDIVVNEMVSFAHMFHKNILEPYLVKQRSCSQQLQLNWMGKLSEVALSSGLFAYQFEAEHRAQALFDWMQKKLEKDNDFDKMQAAWVALREVSHLETVDIQEKLVSIEIALEKYKQLRLNQMLLKVDTDEKVQLEEGEM
ncbi:hypothetical protein NCZ17_09590 [Acinetobacter modestus]|uniref:hypothetical protein n=1 Tax=Acinetobacter modestus TaxID=1776740 RepID=UPI00202DF6B4|nr:hypothetical protein [Acinetobacter modestus]MCM1959624.1 hypothetical protein [Acinetobacter modestus]